MMIKVSVVDVGEIVNLEVSFCLLDTFIGEHNGLFLFFNGEVIAFAHCPCKTICHLVHFT